MRSSLLLTLALAAFVSAHTVMTYPGWRGNNLKTNDEFPYGMQWMYPCESSHPSQDGPVAVSCNTPGR